jgi:hypothetical protein
MRGPAGTPPIFRRTLRFGRPAGERLRNDGR